jgi:hypothetical protein
MTPYFFRSEQKRDEIYDYLMRRASAWDINGMACHINQILREETANPYLLQHIR